MFFLHSQKNASFIKLHITRSPHFLRFYRSGRRWLGFRQNSIIFITITTWTELTTVFKYFFFLGIKKSRRNNMKINICLSQHYVFIFNSDIRVAKGGHNNVIIIIINSSCNSVYFFNWWPQSIITTSRKMRILRWWSSEFMQIVAELSLKVVPQLKNEVLQSIISCFSSLAGRERVMGGQNRDMRNCIKTAAAALSASKTLFLQESCT